jgi:hypothetical protein
LHSAPTDESLPWPDGQETASTTGTREAAELLYIRSPNGLVAVTARFVGLWEIKVPKENRRIVLPPFNNEQEVFIQTANCECRLLEKRN